MSKAKYDLILVGTGFASSFFLKKYLQKNGPGKRVLVLERGRLFKHSERLSQVRDKTSVPLKLESQEGSFINMNPSKPWIFDVNFGGSSNCWWACTPRFMPNDFSLKSLYGLGQDWPITYNELEQYYCEAEDIMSISGPEHTPFPKSRRYPLPAHKLSTTDKKMQAAHGDRQWISQPSGRPSTNDARRSMCCSTYACNLCPVNAKFSIENSLMHIYDDPRVELMMGLQVYMVEFNNGTAKKVMAAPTGSDPQGFQSQSFEGEVIALGTNPIFNSHILLNSGDTNPLTGKGLGEQRSIFAEVDLEELDNVGGTSSITANGYMLYDGPFRKDYASCLIENHNMPALIRNEQGKWRKIIRLKFVFEELPDNNNRVKLSDNIFKPIIDYKIPEDGYVTKARTAMRQQLEKIVAPLKPESIHIDKDYVDTECHVLSSVKMGKSIIDSVVDKNLIHHQYRNLFVLGGSAFPTISAANPTLTLSALSLMTADANF
jgi:choline dehydrogenase-like flavoprotein